jgi:hypothetical protein
MKFRLVTRRWTGREKRSRPAGATTYLGPVKL